MWKNIGIEHCLSYINLQLNPGDKRSPAWRYTGPGPPVRPTVTISRTTGSGGRSVGARLAEYLQACAPGECPWTVFDRNLMETVMEEHHLPKRIAAFMPEKHKSMVRDMMEELLGLHPSSWTIVQQAAETILNLAQMGYVILVGRGATIVTRRLTNVLHVRLVGPLEKRVVRVKEVYDLGQETAEEFIRREDQERRRYVKEHFHQDIDNPLLFDLVINTEHFSYDAAARLIGDAVINRFQLTRSPAAAVR